MFGFFLGALTGGLASWYCDQIRKRNMSGARDRSANALSSLSDTAETVPERTSDQSGSELPPRTGRIDLTSSC